jgi:hypothetical protein
MKERECRLCIREAHPDHDYCVECLREQIEQAEREQEQIERQYRRDVL